MCINLTVWMQNKIVFTSTYVTFPFTLQTRTPLLIPDSRQNTHGFAACHAVFNTRAFQIDFDQN